MEPLKEIGSKIKFYRIQKHMTIKDLAESICKSQATLYKYEKGQIALDLSVLYDIASALSMPWQIKSTFTIDTSSSLCHVMPNYAELMPIPGFCQSIQGRQEMA